MPSCPPIGVFRTTADADRLILFGTLPAGQERITAPCWTVASRDQERRSLDPLGMGRISSLRPCRYCVTCQGPGATLTGTTGHRAHARVQERCSWGPLVIVARDVELMPGSRSDARWGPLVIVALAPELMPGSRSDARWGPLVIVARARVQERRSLGPLVVVDGVGVIELMPGSRSDAPGVRWSLLLMASSSCQGPGATLAGVRWSLLLVPVAVRWWALATPVQSPFY